MPTASAFGDFVLEPQRRRLLRRGVVVPVNERSYATLLELLERPGEVVSKRELLDAVWPDAVVGEESLAKAVSELRAALEDSAAEPRYVQTVPRRGYRFIGELVELSRDADAGPAAPPARRRRGAAALWAGIVAAAAAVTAGIALLHDGPDPPFLGGAFERLPLQSQSTFKPAFAHHSNLLAAVVEDPVSSRHELWLVPPGGERPLRLTSGVDVRGPVPVFSHDDARVLFTHYRHDPDRGLVPEILEVPVLGGEVKRVLEGVSAVSPSPDGTLMACARVGDDGTFLVVRDAAGDERVLAERGFWPRWSPDGRWIAFTTSDPEGAAGHLWVVRPDGRDRRRLTDTSAQLYGLCWTPDSRWVLYAASGHSRGDLYAASPVRSGVHRLTSGPDACSAPTVSHDGRRVVFAYTTAASTLYRADDLGSPPHRLHGGEPIYDAALSPDGRRVAMVLGEPGATRRVALLELGDGSLRNLTELDAAHVRWTPDGATVYLAAPSPDGARRWVWRVAAHGGLPEVVAGGEHSWLRCDPSPDGRRLAATRRDGELVELTVIDLETGSEAPLVAAASITDLRWSPDGAWVAYSGGRRPADAASSGIWVVAASGGPPRRLSADGACLSWLGAELLFARETERRGLWRVGLDGAPPRPVPRPVEDGWGFTVENLDLGPHGRPFVIQLVVGSTSLYSLSRSD